MTIERLRAAHSIDGFSCGNEDLDQWLRQSALSADRAGTARVYLSVADNGHVNGFFALVPHVVRRLDIPPSIGHGGPDLIPAYLLARLAISEVLQGSGCGGELLVLALDKILEAVSIGGGRVIVVDAIDERAAEFYRHHGFKTAPTDPARLLMKASTAARSIGIDWP